MKGEALIQIKDVNVTLAGRKVLSRITWRLLPDEHWVFVGPNGSGKSTLLKLIRGELWPDPAGHGSRTYAFDGDPHPSAIGVREKIALVSPELQERYLQQDWSLSGQEMILTGFLNTDLLYQKPTSSQTERVDKIICEFGLEILGQKPIQQMSAGELRKLLIARALVNAPRVLILDEFCDGLDTRSRLKLLETVEQVARTGTQLLYTTHRPEEILPAISHAVVLRDGRIARQGLKDEIVRANGSGFDSPPGRPRLQNPREFTPVARESGRAAAVQASRASRPVRSDGPDREGQSERFFFRIRNADVFLDRNQVLTKISWEMKPGENWAILGPNGAGKSTLLKLIYGELPAAAGGHVQRFNDEVRKNIGKVKRRIGYISFDLQANYRENLSGAEVIASGFFSSVGLIDRVSLRQKHKIRELIRSFHLEELAAKSILRMSYGEFRKILLARALVHDPSVIILDEPFDGLDLATRVDFGRTLERLIERGSNLVVVTHHLADLPNGMTHAMVLEKGRVAFQGKMSELPGQYRIGSIRRSLFR
ncbi:MAG: ATP-binding cassette domain-containing protein [Verrucomicrobiota bacterium]